MIGLLPKRATGHSYVIDWVCKTPIPHGRHNVLGDSGTEIVYGRRRAREAVKSWKDAGGTARVVLVLPNVFPVEMML